MHQCHIRRCYQLELKRIVVAVVAVVVVICCCRCSVADVVVAAVDVVAAFVDVAVVCGVDVLPLCGCLPLWLLLMMRLSTCCFCCFVIVSVSISAALL